MEEERVDVTGICEQFMVEIWNYLASKFEDMPEYEMQEVSAYIANRFGVSIIDILRARDDEWREYVKVLDEDHRNSYRRLAKEYDKLKLKTYREKGDS